MRTKVQIPGFAPGEICEIDVDSTLAAGLTTHFLFRRSMKLEADGVLVHFAPAKPDTDKYAEIYFAEKQLINDLQNYDLIFVSDPALQVGEPRKYSLGIMPDHDGIEIIVDALERVLGITGHSLSNIFFYGHDHGGFLALQVATFFPESSVMVHSPITQALNVQSFWENEIKSSVLGMLDKEFGIQHPARNNVWQRMLQKKRVPRITILTNRDDYFRDRLYRLFVNIVSIQETEIEDDEPNIQFTDIEEIGDCRFISMSEVQGHRMIPHDVLIKYLDEFLQEKPVFFHRTW